MQLIVLLKLVLSTMYITELIRKQDGFFNVFAHIRQYFGVMYDSSDDSFVIDDNIGVWRYDFIREYNSNIAEKWKDVLVYPFFAELIKCNKCLSTWVAVVVLIFDVFWFGQVINSIFALAMFTSISYALLDKHFRG